MGNSSVIESVLDNLPVALFAKEVTDNFRFVLWNKKQEEVTTIPAERALGKNDYDLFSNESADYFRKVDQSVLKRGKATEVPEEIITTENQREVHLRTIKIPVHDQETGRILIVGISEDVSEQVQSRRQLDRLNRHLLRANEELQITQLQLIQAEKLESIGRLAAGVAHEVKNPLGLLLLGVDYLSQGILPDDPNLPTILQQMRDAVGRADRIVRGLVDFSSQRALTREPTDLASVIEAVLLLAKHEIVRSNTTVDVQIRDGLPLVFLDMSKFEQVLINLVINAIQAMESSKSRHLEIHAWEETLSNVSRNEGARTRELFRSGDRVVILEIRDSGPGIAPSDANRLFDPFFTTKATGKGTGLGLSVARRIIELHSGTLSLKNRTGESGAVARIVLPTKIPTSRVSIRSVEALKEEASNSVDTKTKKLTS